MLERKRTPPKHSPSPLPKLKHSRVADAQAKVVLAVGQAKRAAPAPALAGRAHDERALALAVDVLGEDRVCLGTDYPFVLGETTAASCGDTYAAGALIEACALPALVKDKLRGANALAWLGMSAADFNR